MTEGRKCQISLLNEHRLDFVIKPRLYVGELIDLVSSHFKLKEKQYFGLAFVDEIFHYHWLNTDKHILEHDFVKRTGILLLHFSVRYYVETIGLLRDAQTIELFYYNARQAIFKGQVECDSETVFELAAHVLQAHKGDYTSDEDAAVSIRNLPVIPTVTLKEHPSISFCEERVITYYRKLLGTSPGLAIVNYMTIVESLPTYGIHFHEVKDKRDIPWWLGISLKGISVYDRMDRNIPRQMFVWKNLENLYYRDKKFSIEIHDQKRIIQTTSSSNLYDDAVREPVDNVDELSEALTHPTTQVSVSRRTFGASNVIVHSWLTARQQLTKSIWSTAVDQHQFYLDRKRVKGLVRARSSSEIAVDLSCYCSLCNTVQPPCVSQSDVNCPSVLRPSVEFDRTEDPRSVEKRQELCLALRKRKDALEEEVRVKLKEIKMLCFQEGELTGCLPEDTQLDPGDRLPVFKRRVGTAFAIHPRTVNVNDGADDHISSLEMQFDLQTKIVEATRSLAQDKSTSKHVRKQRRKFYNCAVKKMEEIEKALKLKKAVWNVESNTRIKHKEETTAQLVDCAQCADSSVTGMILAKGGTATLPPQHPFHRRHRQKQHQYQSSRSLPVPHLQAGESGAHRIQQSMEAINVSSVLDVDAGMQRSSLMSLNLLSSSPSSATSPSRGQTCIRSDMSTDSSTSSLSVCCQLVLHASLFDGADRSVSSSLTSSDVSDRQTSSQRLSKHSSLDRVDTRAPNVYRSLDRAKQPGSFPLPSGCDVSRRWCGGPHNVTSGVKQTCAVPPLSGLCRKAGSSVSGTRVTRGRRLVHANLLPQAACVARPSHHPFSSQPNRLALQGHHVSPEPNRREERGALNVSTTRDPMGVVVPQTSPPITTMDDVRFSSPFVTHCRESPAGRAVCEKFGASLHQPFRPPNSPQHVQSKLVTLSCLKVHTVVTKPYETSDFYKYSERLRKKRMIESYQHLLIGSPDALGSPRSISPDTFAGVYASSASHCHSHALTGDIGGCFSHADHSCYSPVLLPTGHGTSDVPMSCGTMTLASDSQACVGVGESACQTYNGNMAVTLHSSHIRVTLCMPHDLSAVPFHSHQQYRVSSPATAFQALPDRLPYGQGLSTCIQQTPYKVQCASDTKHVQYLPPTPLTCEPVMGRKN